MDIYNEFNILENLIPKKILFSKKDLEYQLYQLYFNYPDQKNNFVLIIKFIDLNYGTVSSKIKHILLNQLKLENYLTHPLRIVRQFSKILIKLLNENLIKELI